MRHERPAAPARSPLTSPSTLALTVADRQYAAVARPTVSPRPTKAATACLLLTDDLHRGMTGRSFLNCFSHIQLRAVQQTSAWDGIVSAAQRSELTGRHGHPGRGGPAMDAPVAVSLEGVVCGFE
jgi:hypothetical protein